MVCFRRLAHFVANEVRRRVNEEGFSCPNGDSRIVFRCTTRGKYEEDYAYVELTRQFDRTYVIAYSRSRVDGGVSTLHNRSEHVIHDESKAAELLEQYLDALQERVVNLNYGPPEFKMQIETNVRRDNHLEVDVHEIELFKHNNPWTHGVTHGVAFPDYYSILGIAENASNEDIKAAFARQVLESHPDKQGPLASNEQRSAASSLTRALLKAKNVLQDNILRASYDAERARCKTGSSTSNSRDHRQPSEFSSTGEDVDMAQVWEAWINVVIEGFKHRYSTDGDSGERAINVISTLLPPLLGTTISGERGLRLGLVIATIMNQGSIMQSLRDLTPQDQELFMHAMEDICKKMWH